MSLIRKEKIVLFAVILLACVFVVGSWVYDMKRAVPKAKNRAFEIHFQRLIQGLTSKAVIMPTTRWL